MGPSSSFRQVYGIPVPVTLKWTINNNKKYRYHQTELLKLKDNDEVSATKKESIFFGKSINLRKNYSILKDTHRVVSAEYGPAVPYVTNVKHVVVLQQAHCGSGSYRERCQFIKSFQKAQSHWST